MVYAAQVIVPSNHIKLIIITDFKLRSFADEIGCVDCILHGALASLISIVVD